KSAALAPPVVAAWNFCAHHCSRLDLSHDPKPSPPPDHSACRTGQPAVHAAGGGWLRLSGF
ncbi:hypothetical protein ABTE74_22060, partial [Acinetobacter baumannii]